MRNHVELKMGAATARLHERVMSLMSIAAAAGAPALYAHGSLGKLAMRVLCGEFHDYRSGHVLPKGELVESLRAVSAHPAVDAAREDLVHDVLRGEFSDGDDEASKWVARMFPDKPIAVLDRRPAPDPRPVELNDREWRVHTWLYRYIEVYGRAPTLREIGAGIGMQSTSVHDVLVVLERKGVVSHVGGRRGWVPTRAP